MNQFFRTSCLLLVLTFAHVTSPVEAWNDYNSCEEDRIYVGAFGGWLFSNSTKLTQLGNVFFSEASGGPLTVVAEGHAKKHSTGFGGVQLGYEWSPLCECSDWSLAPAVELEAFFYCSKKKGRLFNDTERLVEREFEDAFNLNSSVILLNFVFALKNPCLCGFSPYIGGGIGAIRTSIRNAKSFALNPQEEGINHFNSDKSDTSWSFAAQLKAGLRYDICQSLHVFAEYRYLYVDSSKYVFGSTVYPSHAPTTPWNVKVNNNHYSAFVLGIQYDL